jgi:peroxin-5
MQYGEAYAALEAAVVRNPAYADLAVASPAPLEPMLAQNRFLAVSKLHRPIHDLYIEAAQRLHESVDPDVQIGLGIMFNISNEYDKAIDCFSAALHVRSVARGVFVWI